MLPLIQLHQDVCWYNRAVGVRRVREELSTSDCRTIKVNSNSNHLVCCCRPNGTSYFEVHWGRARGIKSSLYGQRSLLLTHDHLYCHGNLLFTVLRPNGSVRAPGKVFVVLRNVNLFSYSFAGRRRPITFESTYFPLRNA